MISAVAAIVLIPASVSVVKESWNGFEDSYRISNGNAEVVVVPKLGRVMHYGLAGKANVLWVNPRLKLGLYDATGYRNFGGDKLWPAPQKDWNWPPDAALDGQPWEAEVIPNGIRLKSPLGKTIPVKYVREITMRDIGTDVKFVNQLSNWGSDRDLSVWQVTQVNNPSRVSLTASMNVPYKILMGEKLDPKYHQYNGKSLVVTRHPKQGFKFGSKSREGVIESVVGGVTFRMTMASSLRSRYPDGDTAQQVYTNGDPDQYVEMEQLSPLVRVGGKEILSQTVTWTLSQP